MAKKDYYLKQAEEEFRQRQETVERKYNPSSMNMERMPLGCWMWVLLLVGLAVYGLSKLVVH